MKAFLMYKDRDFDAEQALPWNAGDLVQDLGLTGPLQAMAAGDEFIFTAVRVALLCSLKSKDEIEYRQDVLRDSIAHEELIRKLYGIAVEAIEQERSGSWGWFTPHYASSILHKALETLHTFVVSLKKLRNFAGENADTFSSEGLRSLLSTLQLELTDEYLATVGGYLRKLRFRDGVEVSARLEQGGRLGGYILQEVQETKRCWLLRIFGPTPPYTYYLNPRDESGARSLGQLRDQGISSVATALAQSTDHILSFFQALRSELAFYIGCLNLHGRLKRAGLPLTFPRPVSNARRQFAIVSLYDMTLALEFPEVAIGNDMSAADKDLVIITGANQGGKSTFLRSIGVAQLMMQAGMFVVAESFLSQVSSSIVTHYKREEDVEMRSGKFDEELSRMSEIASHLPRNAMVLFNESFASTDEREGSEIAAQIARALIESGIRVIFVTHLFSFARRLYDQKLANALFLRAERLLDGRRTFRMQEGEPLQTSYGKDLYEQVFAEEPTSRKSEVNSAQV